MKTDKPQILSSLNDLPRDARICLYGAGDIGISLFKVIRRDRPDVHFVCFVDTYKSGERFGLEIITPSELARRADSFDLVVIASVNFREQIEGILSSLGIANYCHINPSFESMSAPDKARCEDVLYAFFDRRVSPDGFDIVCFLYLAEIERMRLGARHLHPVIVPEGDDAFIKRWENENYVAGGTQTLGRDSETSWWWQKNIAIPCCWMLPSCRQLTLCGSRAEANLLLDGTATRVFPEAYSLNNPVEGYSWSKLLKGMAAAPQLPSFRASAKALEYVRGWMDAYGKGRKIVSITLRESPFQPERNSRVGQWVRFAQSLDPQIYWPVFIRDTSVALMPPSSELSRQAIFGEASWNMELRMAFYEAAYVNLFTGSGPSHLAHFNRSTRLVRFMALREGIFECSKEHLEADGLIHGSDFPGATAFQRTVWKAEEFSTICEEFESLCRVIEVRDQGALPEGSENG